MTDEKTNPIRNLGCPFCNQDIRHIPAEKDLPEHWVHDDDRYCILNNFVVIDIEAWNHRVNAFPICESEKYEGEG